MSDRDDIVPGRNVRRPGGYTGLVTVNGQGTLPGWARTLPASGGLLIPQGDSRSGL